MNRNMRLFVLVSLVWTSLATATVKVAYVDLQQALQSVDAGKKAKARLEKEVATKRKELEKQQAALQKEAEQFEKKAAILNEGARAKKQAELQKRLLEFQQKAARTQTELQGRERSLTAPLIKELRGIIEGIGKARKYELILEKNESAVLYAQSGSDITAEVIKRFNAKRK